jgi:electron transfer flavoprotein alpha/beta subunit
MGAKKKPVAVVSAADLGLAAEALAPRERIESLAFPVREKQTEMLEGDAETVAGALVERLRNAGII